MTTNAFISNNGIWNIKGENMKTDLTEMARKIVKECKGFIEANNYEVIKVEENYCELLGTLTETSTNHLGVAHGGYIFGLADTAAGIAAMTDGRTAVTISSNIDYLKAAKTKKLKAIATCTKNGKTISFFEVNIYDEAENLVAKSSLSYCYISK